MERHTRARTYMSGEKKRHNTSNAMLETSYSIAASTAKLLPFYHRNMITNSAIIATNLVYDGQN